MCKKFVSTETCAKSRHFSEKLNFFWGGAVLLLASYPIWTAHPFTHVISFSLRLCHLSTQFWLYSFLYVANSVCPFDIDITGLTRKYHKLLKCGCKNSGATLIKIVDEKVQTETDFDIQTYYMTLSVNANTIG